MSLSLPSHPNLEWLRKSAKNRLTELRAANPRAKLADAQRAVAREHGFPSWRKLKAHVEAAVTNARPADDQTVKQFFALVGRGRIEDVRAVLDADPDPSLLDEEHQGTPLQWAEVSAEITNNPECLKVAEYLTGKA
jgi:hypothetical protein